MAIIYQNIDSVWINTSDGVTVYCSHNHLAGRMTAYIKTPCGVTQHDHFGRCDSIKDGRKKLKELTQADADRIFNQIRNWPSNKKHELEYFRDASLPTDFFQGASL